MIELYIIESVIYEVIYHHRTSSKLKHTAYIIQNYMITAHNILFIINHA